VIARPLRCASVECRPTKRGPVVVSGRARVPSFTIKEVTMWWGIGVGGAILYFIIAFTLGLMTLRNGHGWLFFFGIFFPLLWVFGAFARPRASTA
jgi:hypothetical protein